MLLAAFLFMRKMIRSSDVSILSKQTAEDADGPVDREDVSNYKIPKGVEVFEITGPLFFGATYKFKDAIRFIEKHTKVLIVRMRHVPIIDATGLRTLEEVYKDFKHRGTKLILSEVHSGQVMKELDDTRLLFALGKANVTDSFEKALRRCKEILEEKGEHHVESQG